MIGMHLSDFDYELPENLVVDRPPAERGTTRLLVLNRTTGELQHRPYTDLVEYIRPGDVIILNDTKVIKARLVAVNAEGKQRELLLLEDHHNTDFTHRKVLYRGKLRAGETLIVNDTPVMVTTVLDGGIAEISADVNLLDLAEHVGSVPLPPYMHREADASDTERYQTVFAKHDGSVAAPTASLNFTKELQQAIEAKGGKIAYLTLHVGLGTFLPIRTDNITEHKMHSEYFEVPLETVEAIQAAKASGGRVFAVGTTVTRTLEYCYNDVLNGHQALSGEADIFMYPGYEFKVVDVLLTNFHAPASTVLMLAAAFASWDKLHHSYEEAKAKGYAFLSYGDSTLII
jgi:S-adenosylmethionine:tRNA ribosyltransferase-isomerase